jgi:uncharacterized protein YciI
MPAQALFLYRIQPVRDEMISQGTTPEEEDALASHFDYLESLTRSGVVHLAGRTLTSDYAGFGIILFSAESEEAARRIMLDDPAVKGRVMRAELYPFRASLVGKLPAQAA